MKRIFAVLLILLACLFTGCTGAYSGVNELLRAPRLAGPQNEIQKALTYYLGETPQLKYPQHGDTLSPFLFGDWNGDGVEDAAALYVSGAKGQNVHLAILEQTTNGWVVTQEREGLAFQVDSVATAGMSGEGGMQLLVGYLSASGEKYLTVYAYQDETLTVVMEQAYSQYELQDITGSGLIDLILIGPETGDGLQLQMLTTIDGEFIKLQELQLSEQQFVSCEGLHISKSADGSYYLVLDGSTGTGGNLASMVLRYNAMHQQLETVVPPSGVDIYTETQRYSSLLKSMDIDGDGSVEIPRELTDTGGLLTVNRLAFLTWMDYTSETKVQKSFGIADLENGYYLQLPAEWQGKILVTDGSQPGSWEIRGLDGEILYLQVRVVDSTVQSNSYFRLGNIGSKRVQARIWKANLDEDGKSLLTKDLVDGFLIL